MRTAVKLALKQRTPEWLEARRSLITATDISAIVRASAWRSEADVAADKLGTGEVVDHLRMRIGTALEPLIAKEYEAVSGRKVVRADGLYRHYRIQWAAASLDYRWRKGDGIVECKWTGSRSRFADGLPQDVEAQVQWQLGVTGASRADVAVLVAGDELRIFEVEPDRQMFAEMVVAAEDFRRKLAAGGPFSRETADTNGSRTPDDGSVMPADDDLGATVVNLLELKGDLARMESRRDELEAEIKTRMGDAAALVGPGFRVTWKSSERSTTDWASIATQAMAAMSEADRTALIAAKTARTTYRVFRAMPTEEGR
ncbi:MAG: YqaJ viral recombinase family protein [Gaiellales bacterium]